MNKHLKVFCERYPQLEYLSAHIESAVKILVTCYKSGSVIYTCGNGGSASDSEHIVGELVKGFMLKREIPDSDVKLFSELYPDQASHIVSNLQQGIPALSLVSNASLMTAIINDLDPAFIFAQQVYGMGREGDVLIAISTSGNSENVCNAAKVALAKGLKVISLTGESGGRLKNFSSINLNTPSSNVAFIQEYHLPIYHCLCIMLEESCFA